MCSELQLETESSSLQVSNRSAGTGHADETDQAVHQHGRPNGTITPPDYESVAKDECLSIPIVHHHVKVEYSDKPPSYQSLFGTNDISPSDSRLHSSSRLCRHHSLRPSQRLPQPPPSLACVQVNRSLPRRRKWERCCTVLTQAAKKNKALTTMYLIFLVVGMSLPLSMLVVGGVFSQEMGYESSVLLLLWTGTALLVFVLWHACIHLMGLYLKKKETHASVYWTMRFCHCGCCIWDIVLVYFSIVFWSQFDPKSDLDLLTGLVVGSLSGQYIIVLYCVIEMIVDAQINFPIHHL